MHLFHHLKCHVMGYRLNLLSINRLLKNTVKNEFMFLKFLLLRTAATIIQEVHRMLLATSRID